MDSHGALFVVENITEGNMQHSSLANSERSKSTAKICQEGKEGEIGRQ